MSDDLKVRELNELVGVAKECGCNMNLVKERSMRDLREKRENHQMQMYTLPLHKKPTHFPFTETQIQTAQLFGIIIESFGFEINSPKSFNSVILNISWKAPGVVFNGVISYNFGVCKVNIWQYSTLDAFMGFETKRRWKALCHIVEPRPTDSYHLRKIREGLYKMVEEVKDMIRI
jgi:hypothetical protein